jgi:hypothetical protein
MREWKVFILGCILTIIIGSLAAVEVFAQPPDMSQWVGKWFGLKSTQKGATFRFSDSTFLRDSGGGPTFMKIFKWDLNNKEFLADVYFNDNGVWKAQTITFRFLAGTDVKFLWLYESFDATGEGQAFTAILQGKKKNSILQGAKLKTLGGCYVIVDQVNNTSTGSLRLTGKMIDVSKVPVPANIIIH